MANQIPLNFRAAPLEEGFVGTLQEFSDALVARLYAESTDAIAFFAAGATAPTSNVGPWWNGEQFWAWSDDVGAYIPPPPTEDESDDAGSDGVGYPSLRYTVSKGVPTVPDPTKYVFWIVLNSAGKATDIRHYSDGAWKSVYEDMFASYSTTVQMDAAIDAKVDLIEVNYCVSVNLTTDQTVNVEGLATATKILFNSVEFDPDGVYAGSYSRYVAPVDGIYSVACECQIGNGTADATNMEMSLSAYKNGGPYTSSGMAIASPPGDRWYPQLGQLVQMAAGDILEFYIALEDGTNTGNVVLASGGGLSRVTTADIMLVRRL